MKIKEYIEYLKGPKPVLQFQKFFGVHELSNKKKSKTVTINKTVAGTTKDILFTSLKYRKINGNDDKRMSDGNTSSEIEESFSSESDVETATYVISNKFWYYLFLFGTYLGDEVFYATFLPFWFWNIDGAVGRRIVMVWTIIMYIGQSLKDVICWPRPPSPPVLRLQKKWSLEYGMPSTHAMVGVAIPFSVIIYTMNRYLYHVQLGLIVAVVWCSVICLSRIYLGMHSVLDVVVGLLLAVALMIPVVPIVDYLDLFLVTNRWAPILLAVVTVLLIAFYPRTSHWTPTRGDTTTIISFCAGVYIGAWTNYHQGVMKEPSGPPPYVIIWPSWPMCGTGVLRTAIGLCSVLATIAVGKAAQHATSSCLLPEEARGLHTRLQTTIDLSYKCLSFMVLGFNILYFMPNVFKQLRIDRPTYYTEM